MREQIKGFENNPASFNNKFNKAAQATFGEWLDTWMKEYNQNSVSPSTYSSYEYTIKNHIKPQLGIIKLQELRPEHIQKFLNMGQKDGSRKDDKSGGLASWTILKMKNIINGALKQALRNGLIDRNPADAVTPPKLQQKDIRILSSDEQQTFMDALSGYRLEALFKLALATEMRRGEAFGMIWDDVDFTENTININRQVQWDETKKLWYFSKPKYNSFRTLDMDQECMELLKREKARQEKARDYYADLYTTNYVDEDDRINTNGDGEPVCLINIRENGEFIIPRTMQHTSGVIHHQLNYPDFTFHSLRHPYGIFALKWCG